MDYHLSFQVEHHMSQIDDHVHSTLKGVIYMNHHQVQDLLELLERGRIGWIRAR